MPRQIFKNRILAAAGPLPGQLTVDNLKHWTRIRKGEFTEVFDEDATHLLCTREQFNKRVPRGTILPIHLSHLLRFQGMELTAAQSKTLSSVANASTSSTMTGSSSRRSMTRGSQKRSIRCETSSRSRMHPKESKRGLRKGRETARSSSIPVRGSLSNYLVPCVILTDPDFFHIYIDRDFFPYQIELTRDDEVAGEFGQKYTLCVS